MELFPDLTTLPDQELDAILLQLEREEDDISRRRRLLHGRIDILRSERVTRLKARMDAGDLALPPPDALERPLFEGTGELPADAGIELMPDLSTLGDDELRALVFSLEQEEDDVSLRRRVIQGRIDILRAERTRRRLGGEPSTAHLAETLAHGAGGHPPDGA